MRCRSCGKDVSSSAQICVNCGFPDPGMRRNTRRVARAVFDALPGSRIVRRFLGRESAYVLRARLARKYLRGSGIEFGALNARLDVPESVKVTYADVDGSEGLAAAATQMYGHVTAPSIIADIQTMDAIGDASLDFVIANQVIEHVENPLRALRTISRVLRPGGIGFITLPDRRFTFDRRRSVTPLSHLIKDDVDGPEWGRKEHYDDWVHHAEGLDGRARDERVAQMLSENANIHFHVWDYDTMAQMFTHAAAMPDIGLAIEHSQQNGNEGVWILRKPVH